MEIFKTPDHFPDQILSPFPSSSSTSVSALDSFFTTDPRISIPDLKSSATLPPQKLRPIRCNGKSSAEDYADPEAGVSVGDFSGGFYEGGLRAEFGELVFLSRQICGGVGEGMENEVGDSGGSEVRNVKGGDRVGIGAAVAEEERERESPFDSSTESEVSRDNVARAEGSVSRKRRRTTRKKLAGFMLQLVSKVMQKQEAMHNQLMEMLERKERENLMREEAWRQEEIERSRREEQMRAEETSRNMAFISFVQKILAQGLEAPKPLHTCIPVKEEGQIHNQGDVDINGMNETLSTPCDNVQNGAQDRERPFPEAISPEVLTHRWLEVEVEALVQLHASLENNFCNTGAKYSLWDEISARLQNMGYNRPAWKCKEKWESLNNYNVKRSNTHGSIIKSQKYKSFQELDEQHRQGVFRPPCNPSDAAQDHTDQHYAELS